MNILTSGSTHEFTNLGSTREAQSTNKSDAPDPIRVWRAKYNLAHHFGDTQLATVQIVTPNESTDYLVDDILRTLEKYGCDLNLSNIPTSDIEWDSTDISIALMREEDIETFCSRTDAPKIPNEYPRIQLALIATAKNCANNIAELSSSQLAVLSAANFLPVICAPHENDLDDYDAVKMAMISLLSVLYIQETPCLDFCDVAYLLSPKRSAAFIFRKISHADVSDLPIHSQGQGSTALSVFIPDEDKSSVLEQWELTQKKLFQSQNTLGYTDGKMTFRELHLDYDSRHFGGVHLFQTLHDCS